MKVFSYFYHKTIGWSGHRHARYYLAGVSFAESAFFPIPPDVMLVSMGLALPKKSWQYALIATLFSVAGGLFGYIIGNYGMVYLQPYLDASSYKKSFDLAADWVQNSGIWMIVLASFAPFPYKVFTITAGAMHLPVFDFIIGSFIGRGSRFFLVSGLLYFLGERLQKRLHKYIDVLGWAVLILFIIIYIIWKYKG